MRESNEYFNLLLYRQSYDVTIHLHLEGTQIESSNTLDLKNPYFRYTGAPPAAPPGTSTTSPSENYWNHLDTQGARSGKSQTFSQKFCLFLFIFRYSL